ncbi:SCO1664 family protein [Streptomyces sp. PCS3-D2]|nr:SCO1664 family protein [Streptomyces sp. PCS3-D2]WKV76411.1 SCO1664 family protein [Streptomyces sp. PCS3-D2]
MREHGRGHMEELLARGELTVVGRIREASNAVLLCTVTYDGVSADCVYKPVKGERPLWDFPDGNLAQREVAAYLVSEATGWGLVPATVLRDGPYGEGMVQQWIESRRPQEGSPQEELLALVEGEEAGEGWKPVAFADVGEGRTALLVHADDPRLRRLAVLDAVINNGDRKGGHLLPAPDGRIYAIDHGVTFHTEDKLRTLLWGWAGEPLTDEARQALAVLTAELAEGAPLATRLAELITEPELAAVRARVAHLLRTGKHPQPSGQWPAIPWPPV